MITDIAKQQAKQVGIVEYLAGLGIEPKSAKGKNYLYYAPYREDRNPSMLVDSHENIFTDLGGNNDRGDIITLVQLIHQADFKEALGILTSGCIPESFSFIQPKRPSSDNGGVELLKVKELENRALLEYLETRKIPLRIAKKHLQEAYFNLNGKGRTGNKAYFALYFPNEADGAELRSKHFKGCISPKSYSFIKGRQSEQLNVFEGFMDFLSSLAMKQDTQPTYDTLVLNSIALLPKALPLMGKYARVNCFLDNDAGGGTAMEGIKAGFSGQIVDYRNKYSCFKDLSEWWESET